MGIKYSKRLAMGKSNQLKQAENNQIVSMRGKCFSPTFVLHSLFQSLFLSQIKTLTPRAQIKVNSWTLRSSVFIVAVTGR